MMEVEANPRGIARLNRSSPGLGSGIPYRTVAARKFKALAQALGRNSFSIFHLRFVIAAAATMTNEKSHMKNGKFSSPSHFVNLCG